MTTKTAPGFTLAMIKNVAACMSIMEKLIGRGPGRSGIGCFYGHPGYGKTKASVYVQSKTGAVLVEAGQTWTVKTLLSNILSEAGVAPRGTIADMTATAIAALGDESRPLIIDEADKLVDKGMIEIVREIHDKTDAPVLLIGEEMLPHKLARTPRVYDRILGPCLVAAQPCDLADARALQKLYYPKLDIADDLLGAIRETSRGRARLIMDNLETATEWARNSGTARLALEAYAGTLRDPNPPKARAA